MLLSMNAVTTMPEQLTRGVPLSNCLPC